MSYRNKKILDHAKEITFCTSCGSFAPVVAAHSNSLRHGKGTGIKAHDCFIAYVCIDCHDLIDGRKGNLNRLEAQYMWQDAHDKTIFHLFNSGIVK